MDRDYWLRQKPGTPLFPELEWSRPEHKAAAGKLLVVGGSAHGFAAPAAAYAEAVKAGIGTARVLLPSAVQKIVGRVLENGEFAPSNLSGSFSQKALNELLIYANWADGVLLAGDLSRNSEVAIMLEKFLAKSSAPVTLTKDAVDYITAAPHTVLQRPGTLLVLSLAQLQRLAIASKYPVPIAFSMDLLHVVEWLHGYSAQFAPYLVIKHLSTVFVAVNGQVSTTRVPELWPVWRVRMAAYAATWWVQNPTKVLESLTTAVHALGPQ